MKTIALICLLTLLGGLIHAQNAFSQNKRLFIKDHITLSAGLMLREPWQVLSPTVVTAETPTMVSTWSPGIRLGAVYSFNLGKRFGFETGFTPALYWEKLAFDFKDPEYLPSYNRISNTVLELPLRVFYRFSIAKRLWIQPSLGLSFMAYGRKTQQSSYTILFSQDSTIYRGQSVNRISENQSLFWNWHGGLAFAYQLPNDDFIRLGLSTNLIMDGQNFQTGTGTYGIQNGVYTTLGAGYLTNRGHMIALDLGYTFSRTRELGRDLRWLEEGE